MTLPIEIAQLPTLDTVQSTTRLLVQDGVTGTPYQQTTVGKVFLDLVDEIGTGTIVAGDVVISGGTADLDLLIAAEGTITDATIIGGTGTFATGSISTLAVAGTLTAGTIAATTINAGTVDISSGKATLATAVVTTGTVGTLTSTTGTIATLNAGTITIGTGTGTLTALNVTGTLDVGVGNVTTANIGTVDISSGTAALQSLTADSGTITALSAPTLAVSGTATVGHVAATSVTASGAIVGASGTITTVNAGTVAVSGKVSAATGTITDLASTTLAATGTATIGHAAATSATVGTLVASAGTVTLESATITDAVVSKGTIATLIANAGTVSLSKGTITDLAAGTVSVSGTAIISNIAGTVINAGTITSSGAVSGASGTFTTGTIPTLGVSGTATVGHVIGTTGTIASLTSTTLAATGTATIGHVIGTTGTITTGTVGTLTSTSGTIGTIVANAGTVTLGKGTITDLAASTLAVSGTATVNTMVGTIATISTLTANAGTVTLGKATITDAVVTTGTVGTLIANAGTIALAKGTVTDLAATTVAVSGTASIANIVGTVISAGTVTSSGAVSGASGTFTTATIPTLAVSGTATVGTMSIDGNTTTTGDAAWSLFGAVETDSTGAPISWVETDGTRNFGRVKAADLIATKGTIDTAIMTDATATVMNAITLSVDGNTSSAGDARWGLFGALETDSTGAPIGFTSTDGVRVFKSARIGTLVLNSEPTASDHAVTKKYVDEASGGTSGAYTGIELQARDAQALAQSMAVRDQTNATIATPCWKYSHVIHYGQSFALGFGSAGVISTTAGPDGTFSFGSRPANTVATDVFTQAGSAAFLDMTISAGSEVPALGMANMLRRSQLFAYNLVNDTSRQIVVNAAGKGGTSLEDLSKGATPTEYYGQLTDLIDKSVTAAGSDTYGVAAICLLQGEENYADAGADNTEAGYKATLESFATDFATDSKTATTQTYSPGLFLCQTSSVWDTAAGDITAIGNAQLSASQDNANIYLIGPYYAYPDDGTNHLTSDGYRWLGEQFGKVINKVLVQGEGWLPCHITAAWFRGDKVLLEYHVPEPPLQIQQAYVEETLTSFTNYGFRLGDDAGAISISSVEVKKSTIVITMARETSTAANPWVQYAGRATYDGCGNICDSDPTISYATDSISGDPYPLWNWAVAQRLTIVEDV